jgi:hypothetical protein
MDFDVLPNTEFRAGPGQGRGSTNVVLQQYIFNVEGYNIGPVLDNTEVDKVGPVSGQTYGRVNGTCRNVDDTEQPITLLCQVGVIALMERGDSGGPVFSGGNFYGIATELDLSGTAFYYSPMSAIIQQLSLNNIPLYYCYC